MRFSLVFVLMAGVAGAQEVDCTDPQSQSAMNICAYQDWQASDAALNRAYREAIARAREMDAGRGELGFGRRVATPDGEEVSTEEALRKAQRAWLVFRDYACLAESDLAYGGTLSPLLNFGCAAAFTRAQTEWLDAFRWP